MGLRELTFIAVILGTTTVAGADSKPARTEPKAAKPARPAKPANQPAAEPKAEQPDPAAEAGQTSAATEAEPETPHVVGPRKVGLGNNTVIDLPEGFTLIERAVAQDILRKGGNSPEGVVGIVGKIGRSWHVIIDYDDSGYIDDDDADDLDADDLLESYREGTREQNKTRKALGRPDLEVDGWTEKPRYDRGQHHLVWGLIGHSVENKFVNFFTRVLGRNGYLSLDLIADPEEIESAKQEALVVLQATRFNPGWAYTDHVSSDKSSGVGLRGLVLGGTGVAVAAKMGLFAKFGALLLKLVLVLKKGIILVVIGIGGLFRWLFRRKSSADSTDPVVSQDPPPDPPPSDGAGPG